MNKFFPMKTGKDNMAKLSNGEQLFNQCTELIVVVCTSHSQYKTQCIKFSIRCGHSLWTSLNGKQIEAKITPDVQVLYLNLLTYKTFPPSHATHSLTTPWFSYIFLKMAFASSSVSAEHHLNLWLVVLMFKEGFPLMLEGSSGGFKVCKIWYR